MADNVYGVDLVAGTSVTITKALIAGTRGNLASYTINSTASGSTFIGARVFHSAAQSLANATLTALAFNSERFDTDTCHDTVTNNSRLTCKTAGYYVPFASARFAANATGYRQLAFKVNNTTFIALTNVPCVATAGVQTDVPISTPPYLFAVNDYVELLASQNSGGALNIESGAAFSPEFGWVKVG